MKERELRRSLAVLPMGTVMKLTDLTARQIRYYEEQNLLIPIRTEGNHRLYSLNDIDILLEIKDLLAEGNNMVETRRLLSKLLRKEADNISRETLNRVLEPEFEQQSRFYNSNPTVFNQPRL